jgi:hypothetical protein
MNSLECYMCGSDEEYKNGYFIFAECNRCDRWVCRDCYDLQTDYYDIAVCWCCLMDWDTYNKMRTIKNKIKEAQLRKEKVNTGQL